MYNMKNLIKNSIIYSTLINIRKLLRVIYSVKSRSRFFWNIRKGDDFLSLDYPLNQNSTVLIIGAFEGDYLSKLNKKFECKIMAFEPMKESFDILKGKFASYGNISLFNFGLSDKTEEVYFSESGESSSFYGKDKKSQKVLLKSYIEFIDEEKIDLIDLVYMNIEGGEYDLLLSMLDHDLLKKTKHLQIQYHKINNTSKIQRKLINLKIGNTHKRVFNFPFIWERWDLTPPTPIRDKHFR
jgi:FkbM family methyltransferase